ncbi:RNA chaperone Hfq [Paraburkholderia sp. BL6669N2]|uniref:RNA chaperone Hfq n=1 Tax=Paraburkholderia sp. BL6669N2 TaxID=1938807 RepID=UPI00286860D2|nr:RNA chaperone Hfq [Paraburkholderia sp. BL6669N2]
MTGELHPVRVRAMRSAPPGETNALYLDWLGGFRCRRYDRSIYAWTSNMTTRPDVQDDFLHMLIKNKAAVNVFLVNGIRLSGQLAAFDRFSILLVSGSGSQLVF